MWGGERCEWVGAGGALRVAVLGRIWEKQLSGKRAAAVRKAGLRHKYRDWP